MQCAKGARFGSVPRCTGFSTFATRYCRLIKESESESLHSVVGPTMLIILNTGNTIREVELVRPSTWSGRTTWGNLLIAASNFLYIDDQRYMHFSGNMDDTDFIFP